MTRLEPEKELRNFLRANLTDFNSSARGSAQWVYSDWPHKTLSATSYPRVVVSKIDESGDIIGLAENNTWDEVVLQVDVLVHRDTGVLSNTHTDESVGTISNSPRISFDYEASTVTNIKHDGSAFGTVTMKVNNGDFTAAASLTADNVEWSLSSGDLNFSSTDLTNLSGETITATYVEKLEGEELAKRIGREIVEKIRTLWRTDTTIGKLIIPSKISGPKVAEFNDDRLYHRVMIEYSFRRFNTGEEVN